MVTAEPTRRRRWWAWALCILIAACVVLSLPWASALRHDSAVLINRTGRNMALGPLADWVAVEFEAASDRQNLPGLARSMLYEQGGHLKIDVLTDNVGLTQWNALMDGFNIQVPKPGLLPGK